MSLAAMIWAFDVPCGSATRKLVLLKLADNANDQGEAFPSIPTIARQCELSEREVIRTIHELESLGLVRVVRTAGRRNRYHLLMNQCTTVTRDRESPVTVSHPTRDRESPLPPPSTPPIQERSINGQEEEKNRAKREPKRAEQSPPPPPPPPPPKAFTPLPDEVRRLAELMEIDGRRIPVVVWDELRVAVRQHGWEACEQAYRRWCKAGYRAESYGWLDWVGEQRPAKRGRPAPSGPPPDGAETIDYTQDEEFMARIVQAFANPEPISRQEWEARYGKSRPYPY